jgi:hypothetical protein
MTMELRQSLFQATIWCGLSAGIAPSGHEIWFRGLPISLSHSPVSRSPVAQGREVNCSTKFQQHHMSALDLPLSFHPTATGAARLFTPFGAA